MSLAAYHRLNISICKIIYLSSFALFFLSIALTANIPNTFGGRWTAFVHLTISLWRYYGQHLWLLVSYQQLTMTQGKVEQSSNAKPVISTSRRTFNPRTKDERIWNSNTMTEAHFFLQAVLISCVAQSKHMSETVIWKFKKNIYTFHTILYLCLY